MKILNMKNAFAYKNFKQPKLQRENIQPETG